MTRVFCIFKVGALRYTFLWYVVLFFFFKVECKCSAFYHLIFFWTGNQIHCCLQECFSVYMCVWSRRNQVLAYSKTQKKNGHLHWPMSILYCPPMLLISESNMRSVKFSCILSRGKKVLYSLYNYYENAVANTNILHVY